MWRKLVVLFAVAGLGAMYFCQLVRAENTEKHLIHIGEAFPDVALKEPENPEDRAYLGLKPGENFMVKDIQADLVLVEILNVHCVHCQAQAPTYNELFNLIERDASARKGIKMLGIAVGNNEFEVKYFRQKYQVPFPIVSDQRFEVHRAVGGPGTPFSIFVRVKKDPRLAVVASTHKGVSEDALAVFNDMQALRTLDIASIQQKSGEAQAEVVSVEPPMPEAELTAKVKEAMGQGAEKLSDFQRVELGGSWRVYTGLVQEGGNTERLFAEVVSRPTVCDVCHDVHFFYIFNGKGRILQFVPIQLTKYGNEEWTEADVEHMRRRLVGRYVFRPFNFEPEVDAVSTATITSAVIFDSMNHGKELFEALKAKDLIH